MKAFKHKQSGLGMHHKTAAAQYVNDLRGLKLASHSVFDMIKSTVFGGQNCPVLLLVFAPYLGNFLK